MKLKNEDEERILRAVEKGVCILNELEPGRCSQHDAPYSLGLCSCHFQHWHAMRRRKLREGGPEAEQAYIEKTRKLGYVLEPQQIRTLKAKAGVLGSLFAEAAL